MMKELEIDPEVGRTRSVCPKASNGCSYSHYRPEQLNVPDDPGFLPELDFTFDLSAFELPSDSQSSRVSSVLSSHLARSSQTSNHNIDLEEDADLQLEIPPIDTPSGFGGMSVGGRMSAGAGSITQAALDDLYEDSPFIDDAEFEIAPDGSLVAVETDRSRVDSTTGNGRAISESGFSARVRIEHEAGAAGVEVSDNQRCMDGTNNARITSGTSKMTASTSWEMTTIPRGRCQDLRHLVTNLTRTPAGKICLRRRDNRAFQLRLLLQLNAAPNPLNEHKSIDERSSRIRI